MLTGVYATRFYTLLCALSMWFTAGELATLIFYAPPHGLVSILADAAEVLGGDRSCVVARELTKASCCICVTFFWLLVTLLQTSCAREH